MNINTESGKGPQHYRTRCTHRSLIVISENKPEVLRSKTDEKMMHQQKKHNQHNTDLKTYRALITDVLKERQNTIRKKIVTTL